MLGMQTVEVVGEGENEEEEAYLGDVEDGRDAHLLPSYLDVHEGVEEGGGHGEYH